MKRQSVKKSIKNTKKCLKRISDVVQIWEHLSDKERDSLLKLQRKLQETDKQIGRIFWSKTPALQGLPFLPISQVIDEMTKPTLGTNIDDEVLNKTVLDDKE